MWTLALRVSVVFFCGSQISMRTEMLLVCGEDTNRFGQLEHRVVFFCFFFVKTWLPFMELVYSATLKKHIFRKSYSRTS